MVQCYPTQGSRQLGYLYTIPGEGLLPADSSNLPHKVGSNDIKKLAGKEIQVVAVGNQLT
jgi:hypothetical protein